MKKHKNKGRRFFDFFLDVAYSFYCFCCAAIIYVGGLSILLGHNWVREFITYQAEIKKSIFMLFLFSIFSFLFYVNKEKKIYKYCLFLYIFLCPVFIALYFTKNFIPNSLILFTITFILIGLSLRVKFSRYLCCLFIILFAIPSSMSAYKIIDVLISYKNQGKLISIDSQILSFSQTPIELTRYRIPTRKSGGAITPLNDSITILSNVHGDIYIVSSDKKITNHSVKRLSTSVPMNKENFFNEHSLTSDFRVTDILLEKNGDNLTFYAGHHFWKTDTSCTVLRISKLSTTLDKFLDTTQKHQWETIFETSPCLKRIKGPESGGRIVRLLPHILLFSTGDHNRNGVYDNTIYAQDKNNSYGKIMRIDEREKTSSIFTSGHRNPQGLFKTYEGKIYSTEHGPSGGDEFNEIIQDANYGWPVVTYGKEYGSYDWPFNPQQGKHEGYSKPLFTWVPSIAASNLIKVENDLFPRWKDDFLIASLKAKSLFRVRYESLEQQVRYVEQIYIGERIRDIKITPKGTIILWTDDRNIITINPINHQKEISLKKLGSLVFDRCLVCHTLDRNTHGIGPHLYNIINRKIASTKYSYSTALKNKKDGFWNQENLDAFLLDPQKFSPGTSMEFQLQNLRERKAIIQYLTNYQF